MESSAAILTRSRFFFFKPRTPPSRTRTCRLCVRGSSLGQVYASCANFHTASRSHCTAGSSRELYRIENENRQVPDTRPAGAPTEGLTGLALAVDVLLGKTRICIDYPRSVRTDRT